MPIYRGAYYAQAIQVVNRSDGLPINITGWQFSANLKNAAGDTVLAMSTSGGHFVVFDGANGWFRFKLSEAQTTALDDGPVSFALYRTDAAEGLTRIAVASEQVRERD